MNQTILVLGATSAIALAYCRRRAEAGDSFVLVGRRNERLQAIAGDLMARGATKAETAVSDLSDIANSETRFGEFCVTLGVPDQVLLAYGLLGDQGKAEESPTETFRMIDVNFASVAVWLQVCAKQLPRDRPRTVIVIGSVAGDRGRRSNYVYGAAKAGLAAFAEGLSHRLHGTNLHVLLVKPGLVDTPMTAHFDKSGALWTDPDTVAACIDRAVLKRRAVVYCPWFWTIVMAVVRSLPRPIFFRTKL